MMTHLIIHLRAVVLAVWAAYLPGGERMGDARSISLAIAQAVAQDTRAGDTPLETEAAVQAYYAMRESHLDRRPYPHSWDASAGVSCDFLQLPCALIRGRAPVEQARMWLSWVHDVGLGSVDSSPSRARHRIQHALALLANADVAKYELAQ